MSDVLAVLYPWVKSLHIMAVLSWMAGLFYLPRLFVHHTEQMLETPDIDPIFQMMEYKLLRLIMNPAMVVTWICGVLLVFTPGIVDWSSLWIWVKLISVCTMTWFHHWLGKRRKDFVARKNTVSGRSYRMMNEVPTVLMILIVVSVVFKY